MHGLELGHLLVHLLLAVAGGFCDDQVGEVEVGALVGLTEAVARLDERAQVLGQVLFGCRDGFVGHGAQAHDGSAHGDGQLFGEVGAVDADDGLVLVFDGLHCHEGVLTSLGEVLEDFGEILLNFHWSLLFARCLHRPSEGEGEGLGTEY